MVTAGKLRARLRDRPQRGGHLSSAQAGIHVSFAVLRRTGGVPRTFHKRCSYVEGGERERRSR